MTIKERYQRFRQWQLQPIHYQPSSEQHHCNNCGQDYTGRFCPTCGQRSGVGPVGWVSIRQGIMDVWGMGTRSLPYSLWQLLLRPGYLIADYINGRRQVSFPPVKMLVLVALAISIFDQLWGIEIDISVDEEIGIEWLDRMLKWIDSHYDWSALFILLFMIPPTYSVFRYSPRQPRHTLPQGFFIQVFNSTLYLCFLLCWAILEEWLVRSDKDADVELLVVLPLMIFYVYKQLFGYSLWGTLWRSSACWVIWALSLISLYGIVDVAIAFMQHKGMKSLGDSLLIVVLFGLLIWFVLFCVHAINTRGERHDGLGTVSRVFHELGLLVLSFFDVLLFGILCSSIRRVVGEGRYARLVIIVIMMGAVSYCIFILYRRLRPSKKKEVLTHDEEASERADTGGGDQIDRQLGEQADGTAAVARIAAQTAPDEQIKTVHDEGGGEEH